MKKSDKGQKKNNPKQHDIPEFSFKDFTPDEDRIYTEAVTKFREAVAAGKTIPQAFESHAIADQELEALIHADFLKIMIAERHFAGRQSLEEVAKSLDVTVDLLAETRARMLQEVGLTAADQFNREHGGMTPKTHD